MRVVLQRVSRASVTIGGRQVGSIEQGLLLLVGFSDDDTGTEIQWMADKVVGLRVFSDDDGKMNRDLKEVDGRLLVVSQFTLYGDVRKGRRPSFVHAAEPGRAEQYYKEFIGALEGHDIPVTTGVFGAMMDVQLVNDGPVTLVLER